MKRICYFCIGTVFILGIAGCETADSQKEKVYSDSGGSYTYSYGKTSGEESDKNLNPSAEEVIAQEKALAEKNGETSQAPEKTSAPSEPSPSTPPAEAKTSSSPEMNAETQRLLTAEPENPPSEKSLPPPAPSSPPEGKAVESKAENPSPEPSKTEASSNPSKPEPQQEPESKPTPESKPAPESPYVGLVALAPPQKKFVVVDFRNTEIPPLSSKLGVYRGGIFVGSVQITEPIKGTMATADILNGSLQKGDIVR